MPVLQNPKHELFAQALAYGKSADEAYAAAGFRPNRGNASTLKANQSISDRVAELQAGAAIKAEWQAADRLIMLKKLALANCDADPRATIAAIAEANRMQGSHAPAKLQHSVTVGLASKEQRDAAVAAASRADG